MTPRKGAGDEHATSSRNGRHPSAKSTSTGSAGMMGLVRAAAAVRRSKKDGLARQSGENRGEYGPGFRASAGSKGFLLWLTCMLSFKASTGREDFLLQGVVLFLQQPTCMSVIHARTGCECCSIKI